MGICQSCLGRRDQDIYEETDETRLMYDDGHGMQYGSFSDQGMGGDDTVEAQREHEALQRVIAKTSNNMVDVFEIGPNDVAGHIGSSIPFAYTGLGPGGARYQTLVSRLSANGGNPTRAVTVDWLTDDDDDAASDDGNNLELQSNRPASIKTLDEEIKGPLVGTFADAAAAMD